MRDEVLAHLWRTATTGRGPVDAAEIAMDLGYPWFKIANVIHDLIGEGTVRAVDQLPSGAMTYEVVPTTTR